MIHNDSGFIPIQLGSIAILKSNDARMVKMFGRTLNACWQGFFLVPIRKSTDRDFPLGDKENP